MPLQPVFRTKGQGNLGGRGGRRTSPGSRIWRRNEKTPAEAVVAAPAGVSGFVKRPRRFPYTPDSSGRCPVLSPNASSRTPNLVIRLSDRFASGVPFG